MSEGVIRFGVFAGIFALMAVAEVAAPRRRSGQLRLQRWPVNLALVALSAVVIRIVTPFGLSGIAAAVGRLGWGVLPRLGLPPAATAVAAFVALDLLIYFQHRAMHAIPFLWRLHRVHHTDTEMDTTTGVRFHPIEILVSFGLKALAVAVLGVPPGVVLIFELVLNSAAMFNHANWRMPAAWDAVLRWAFVTPDMHRVHHSVRLVEMESNFGFSLPWWDYVFRTYRAAPDEGHTAMRVGLVDGSGSRSLPDLLQLPFESVESRARHG